MSKLTAFAADWEDTMLHSCLSEDVPEGTVKTETSITRSKQLRNTKLNKTGAGLLKDDSDDNILLSPGSINNQTSLTQTSSESSYSSNEDFDDEEDDCCSSGSDESDISLCRTRKFGNELDLNRQRGIHSSELTADSSECVSTSIADFFFGSDGPCTSIAEQEHENASTASTKSQQNVRHASSRPLPVLKKSSLKQVVTILDKSSLNRRKRNVCFNKVTVREYKISISHNPSCSEGPPIELGWEFREMAPVLVDQYEQCRGPKRRLPEFVLSENARRRMLLERGGYSRQDLKEAIREVEHLKRQRILTYMMLPASALDEAAEEMFDALTSAFK